MSLWYSSAHDPPVPSDAEEAARVLHSRRRRKILYGTWRELLLERMELLIGDIRSDAWGEPDLTANALRQIASQQAVLFDGRPGGPRRLAAGPRQGMLEDPVDVLHPMGAGPEIVMADAVRESQLWPLLQRVQRDTLGLREMAVRADITDAGRLTFLPVFPDLCHAEEDPQRPERLRRFAHARLRDWRNDDGSVSRVWMWDVLEVADGVGRYRVVRDYAGLPSDDPDDDVSAVYLRALDGSPAPRGGLQGDLYPYVGAEGPLVPVVLFHAARTATIWDPYEWVEIYEGTLNLGVYWSFWGHILRACSWPQRYAAGVKVRAVGVQGRPSVARSQTPTDPSMLLQFDLDEEYDGGSPVIGQFAAGADPVRVAEGLSKYEQRIASFAGISASDFQRVSGDPRSGYALAISRQAKIEASQRLEPVFRVAVVELLGICAALLNRWAMGAPVPMLPESGWSCAFLAVETEGAPGPADVDTDTDVDPIPMDGDNDE